MTVARSVPINVNVNITATITNLAKTPPFCSHCGQRQKITHSAIRRYDESTGTAIYEYEARCPTYSDWKPWTWFRGVISWSTSNTPNWR